MSTHRAGIAIGVICLVGACIYQDSHRSADDVAPEEPPQPSPLTPTQMATVEVQRVEGMTDEEVTRWLAPARAPLAICRPTEPGLVNVRISSDPDGTTMDIIGATVFDATTRECILRALSLFDEELLDSALLMPPEATTQGSPSDRPQHVSSVITIRW